MRRLLGLLLVVAGLVAMAATGLITGGEATVLAVVAIIAGAGVSGAAKLFYGVSLMFRGVVGQR